MRVFIVTNVNKPKVKPASAELIPWVSQQATVVGTETEDHIDLDRIEADAIVVFGGDGTLLSTARRLKGKQIPVMGVNFGRLGFLASFTPEQFKQYFHDLLQGKLPISNRLMLDASVIDGKVNCDMEDPRDVSAKRKFHSTALNDAVITAGSPFRMIELEVGGDGGEGVRYFGDGLIVATASGSTAYNVSAGGPILAPSVDGICVTPLCPHSLALRPLVMPGSATIVVKAARVNPGTTLHCDGQENCRIGKGDFVVIRKADQGVLLVENPDAREWRTLAEKLNWGVGPNYNATKR
jgi:NAD+ kinase